MGKDEPQKYAKNQNKQKYQLKVSTQSGGLSNKFKLSTFSTAKALSGWTCKILENEVLKTTESRMLFAIFYTTEDIILLLKSIISKPITTANIISKVVNYKVS